MKTLYLIGGTMGVGKSAVSKELNNRLEKSIYLDGDWCWNSNPFVVNQTTKKMVIENITFLLNNFIISDEFENIILSWVMDEEIIMNNILDNLNLKDTEIKKISLIANQETINKRLKKDIDANLRSEDIINKSIDKIKKFEKLNTIKIDTNNKTINEIVNEIRNI